MRLTHERAVQVVEQGDRVAVGMIETTPRDGHIGLRGKISEERCFSIARWRNDEDYAAVRGGSHPCQQALTAQNRGSNGRRRQKWRRGADHGYPPIAIQRPYLYSIAFRLEFQVLPKCYRWVYAEADLYRRRR